MGDTQWIQAELQEANDRAGQHRPARAWRVEYGQRQVSDTEQDRDHANQRDAGISIGKHAKGQLSDEPRGDAKRHELTDLSGREAQLRGENRRQSVEAAIQ
ncbi:hypothetical protein D9M73_262340 [compost metagenome]